MIEQFLVETGLILCGEMLEGKGGKGAGAGAGCAFCTEVVVWL